MYIMDGRSVHDLEDVRQFPLEDGDVIVAGFPKSGTNWLQVMLANLWDDWETTKNSSKRVPNLAGKERQNYRGYESCIASGSPRFMKCHLPARLMPVRWPDHGKVVYIARNPKDVCVSSFYMLKQRAAEFPDTTVMSATMDEHAERFVRGQVPYGPYLDSVIEWYERGDRNLLRVTYEDVRKDPRSFIDSAIAFLGRGASEERISEVLAKTDFDAMRSNGLSSQINVPDEQHEGAGFMRKGQVGGWASELSTYASELIEVNIVRKLEERGIALASG